jgi:hypothetical protein
MSEKAISKAGFLGVIAISVFFSLSLTGLGLYQEGAFYDEKSPDVHKQMAQILSEEMPSDVTRLSFLPNGTNQDCSLSNGQMSERVTLLSPPHEAYVFGTFSRNGTVWEGVSEDPWWLKGVDGQGELFDSEAIGASDFRQLLQQCVAAIRRERHRPPTSKLTKEQNQSSWTAASGRN